MKRPDPLRVLFFLIGAAGVLALIWLTRPLALYVPH